MKTQTSAVIALAALLLIGQHAWALTPQGPGEHSTICTSNGTIRDDELAKMIADAITASGNTPSSVKVFFNSCYGGGMLDDIANAVAPIPFIGASASDSDQVAWGPNDGYASNTGSGSFWSNGLAGAVTGASPGQNVAGTVGAANAADPTAPGGAYAGSLPPGGEPEQPQSVTANGGAGVNWSSGAEAVVFGGNNTNTRHGNNVSNMEGAFVDMWGSDPNSNIRSTGGNPNGSGSTEDLQNMLNGACNDLNPGEELVIYVDDHGNTEFDFDEWWDSIFPGGIVLDPIAGWRSETPGGERPALHEGWEQGLTGNVQQGDEVRPGINLLADIAEPCAIDSFFDVFLDGMALDLPDWLLPGEQAFVPINYDPVLFAEGPHLLEFVPTGGPVPFPLQLLNLELTSGPVNDLTFIIPLLGDYRPDGIVDVLDYIAWRNSLEAGLTELPNDPTPGMIDETDFEYWKMHFGDEVLPPIGSLPASMPVPEPASLCLVVLGLLVLAACRRV